MNQIRCLHLLKLSREEPVSLSTSALKTVSVLVNKFYKKYFHHENLHKKR